MILMLFSSAEITWEKIYQNNPADGKRTRKAKILMMRPPFPPIYHESKRPDVNTILEVIVIVNNAWKVGDLVDWWKDGCYWSAKVAEVLGDDKVKVVFIFLSYPSIILNADFSLHSYHFMSWFIWSRYSAFFSPSSSVLFTMPIIINPIFQRFIH